jgi:hypothetical protein
MSHCQAREEIKSPQSHSFLWCVCREEGVCSLIRWEEEEKMHSRNPYRESPPNFAELAKLYPDIIGK